MRYRAVPAATVTAVQLDELTAFYHRASGITHVLMAPAPEILAVLDRPLTVSELMLRLAAAYDVSDASEAVLQARLDELVAAGLVNAE